MADVVESVRLMELGEHEFITRWHQFVNFVQEHVVLYSGRLHKSLGDGLMLEFADAPGCVRAALAMQAWFHDLNQGLPSEEHVHLRIGAHVADFLADQYDIYGTDVNVAARIASLAGPGEVVISAALRDRLAGALALHLEDLGRCHLKHVKQPVHAFRIGQAREAPVLSAQPVDTRGLRVAVAVLPFASRSEPASESGGETLADELVTALSRSDVLQVVSRMSTAPLDASRDSLHTVSSEVGARYVLTGRARPRAGALVMHAELAEADSGDVVWADSFHPAADAQGLLDGALLSQVVTAVHGAVIERELKSVGGRPLPSVEGARLLLASVGLMHRLSPVDMATARGMLEHLLERWRRHPVTHAWLGHLHVLRVQQSLPGFTRQDEALARAHAAAAVQADSSAVLALAMDGHACVHCASNMEAAGERFAQALSLRPRHSLALLFQAEWLALRGSGRAARLAALQATHGLSLEPMRYLYDAVAALAALADRDAEQALVLAQQSVQRNPRYLPALRTLVVAQVENERIGDARATQQQLFRSSRPSASAPSRGRHRWRRGCRRALHGRSRARACRKPEAGYQRAGSFFLSVMRLMPSST
ncbi:adenylate/guanylate cyclase domain-containing protein [Ramlibacter montanisoli]|uniref:Adenylate/guanylate cyclase domain-containing protein n=1 Tax=Ramlibacter montanisoli TaxID=2732512 RepID=A0A849KA27_9BURK|nr:adenylate/guanylate cyclase domain-containing protein [Ramlibacter montanisoli]NNU45192.1 adenylate/guanylate cyclase domain-containing protein [Ramlibacter montanisoli]